MRISDWSSDVCSSDLILKDYNQTVAKDSAPIRLLSPSGAPDAYFASFGWQAQGLNPPGPDTIWQASGDKLTPATPVTLSAANDRGQRFQIRIAVDQDFMFTVQQTVANARSEEHTSELQSLMRISY